MHSDTLIILAMQVIILGFITKSILVVGLFVLVLVGYIVFLRDEIRFEKKIKKQLADSKFKIPK